MKNNDDPVIVTICNDGTVIFDKYTADDYADTLKQTVAKIQQSIESLSHLEMRLRCLRNEIENISPKK